MREIKFRAWVEPYNKMDYLFGMRSDGIVSMQSNIEGFKVTFMQFTGLRDKNGKEIWEGDIIQTLEISSWYSEGDMIRVEWDECGGWYPFVDNEDNFPYPTADHSIVIGNIYENPELLEESK